MRHLTILGCGSSGGVPRVGQGWGLCDPTHPRNRRRRCSVLVERLDAMGAMTSVLVDTSPDLREQLLDVGASRLDAILFTHAHADHIHGIDDVRPLVLSGRRRIRAYMDPATGAALRRSFSYIFETPPGSAYPPLLEPCVIAAGDGIMIEGPGGRLEASAFALHHGEIDSLGFRFGSLAYTPDFIAAPQESLEFLRDLDVWIIDALRRTPHPSHNSLPQALDWIARMKPRRAILTNMHNDMDYATLARELPHGVEPGYDGMRVLF